MFPFRRILFPVDYSDSCRTIVPHVKEMVRHSSAELTLIHAYALQPAFASRSPDGPLAYDELVAAEPTQPSEMRVREDARLREFAALTFPNRHLELVAEEGEPGMVIHRVIQHQGADLVMMPTRGLGPVRRLLLGSVTAKVLHDATVPVWTGTGSVLADHQPAIPYQSIVCALDDSEETEAVLKAAGSLAHSYRARLFLVRVVEVPPPGSGIDFGPNRRDLIDAADVWLRELKTKLGVEASHSVLDGPIAEGVRQEAVRRKADLVIAGRGHAQSTFSLIWSRLYPIVRESPCPVLSI